MGYQALLFCPDEKTARVVTQVLSDLEFAVEPCHEPFAAVKKLMSQHFDAIVVDCDNEQNAALLFKSARNSGSNQAALSVAVVEGQTGVAKAFRIGANLVLTKPIHVEQSKGTLRVARGLLRKGQSAKPAGVPGQEVPTSPMPASFSATHNITPAPGPGASAFELDAEPEPQPDPADAALLEYMPDSAPAAGSPSALSSASSKQYAWQPRSTMAEPMATALRRAAEAAGHTESDSSGAAETPAPRAMSGTAAAPIRAKESVRPVSVEPQLSSVAAPLGLPENQGLRRAVVEAHDASSREPIRGEIAAPKFGIEPSSGEGGSRRVLWIALVLAALAAGYFGWTRFASLRSAPAETAAPPSPNRTATLPPAPPAAEIEHPAGEATAEPGAQTVTTEEAAPAGPSAGVSETVTPPDNSTPPAKSTAPAKTPVVESGTALNRNSSPIKPEAAAPALVVKNSPAEPIKPKRAAQEAESAPAPASISSGASSEAIAGLVNANTASVARAAPQLLRISQGVSQGLLIKRVQPVYPPQARVMRVEGPVELQATISKTGSVTGIKQLRGDALLGRAALDAVKQWKYKPYYLNGEPVEVQTQITVNFKLP